jgi:hypothetical protein
LAQEYPLKIERWLEIQNKAWSHATDDSSTITQRATAQLQGLITAVEGVRQQSVTDATELTLEKLLDQLSQNLHKQAIPLLTPQWEIPEAWLLLLSALTAGSKEQQKNTDSQINNPALINEIQAFQHYQQAFLGYIKHFETINQNTRKWARENLKINKVAPQSLEEIIHLWCNRYESNYLDEIATPAYQKSHGELCNSYMRLIGLINRLRRQEFKALGMVSQPELGPLLKEHHLLRRELERVRRELKQANEKIDAFQQTVNTSVDTACSETT